MKSFYADLKLNNIKPVYLFCGTEHLLINDALNALRLKMGGGSEWNCEIMEGDNCSPLQVVQAASLVSFLGRRLIIVKHIPWLDKNKNESDAEKEKDYLSPLLKYLAKPNEDTVLALTLKGAAEKRRLLIKAIVKAGSLIECTPLKGESLLNWIKDEAAAKGCPINRLSCEMLSLCCGGNMSLLRMETAKICDYCGAGKEISVEDIKMMSADSSAIKIFALMDAVAARDAAQSIALFRKMLLFGEAEQKILSMLGTEFRDMLRVKECLRYNMRTDDIAVKLNLHSFVTRKYASSCRNFSRNELLGFLETLLNADIAHKSGEGDLRALLEIAIMNICRRENI
jgi:DNA polymerase-3 subunit delta